MQEHKKMPGTVGTVTEQNTINNTRIPQPGAQCKMADLAEKLECVAASMDTLKSLCYIFSSHIFSSAGIDPEEGVAAADLVPDLVAMLDTIQAVAENVKRDAELESNRVRRHLREVEG